MCARSQGGVKFPTGGMWRAETSVAPRARERPTMWVSADLVRGQSRRLKSGWKRMKGLCAAIARGAFVIALGDVSVTERSSIHDTHPICFH